MQTFQNLQWDNLLELLAEHTSNYTRMIADGFDGTDEFLSCEKAIKELQDEIELRISDYPVLVESKYKVCE